MKENTKIILMAVTMIIFSLFLAVVKGCVYMAVSYSFCCMFRINVSMNVFYLFGIFGVIDSIMDRINKTYKKYKEMFGGK